MGAESSCHGGSKVSGVTVSDIIFFNVTLLACDVHLFDLWSPTLSVQGVQCIPLYDR